jgi:hypothetical protein
MAESTTQQIANLLAEAQDAPAFFTKESKPGATITGEISAISLRQTRHYRTKKPEVWDDNSPKQHIVVIVDSTDRKTGVTESHSIYIKWWGASRKAFALAVSDDGGEFNVGGNLTVKYVGEGDQPDPDMDKPKIYEYAYSSPKV